MIRICTNVQKILLKIKISEVENLVLEAYKHVEKSEI